MRCNKFGTVGLVILVMVLACPFWLVLPNAGRVDAMTIEGSEYTATYADDGEQTPDQESGDIPDQTDDEGKEPEQKEDSESGHKEEPETGKEKEPDIEPEPDDGIVTKEVVDVLYLKMDGPGADGKTHFVGEDFDRKYKTLSVAEKGKTMQLNAYYTTNVSDGVMYESADSAGPLGEVRVSWSSSDDDVATVSPNGLITAISDGSVTITAAVAEKNMYEGSAPSKSVRIEISGQSAEYVSKVTIIDEEGNSLSSHDDASTLIDGKNKFFQFHALVTWHDPGTDADRVEDTRKDKVTSSIRWSVGGSEVVATINEDTGRLKTSEYSGNCFVQCSVTGGNGGKAVKDTARVQVDTGEYAYKPADSLTLKVVYQEFPKETVQEHTYSLSELSGSLPVVTGSYTVLGGSRYGVIRASGYLFKDVVGLEGVEIEDVYQFRFETADGYDNPITSKLLYGSGARYYFPNWDIGSRAGAAVVPPILASTSNMMWGESMADPSVPLDEGTRFRLVFGPLWSGEANSSHQIYYIKAITIVLNGAPPAENERPGDGDKGKDGAGSTDEKDNEGNGGGKGKGVGTPGEGSMKNRAGNSDRAGDKDAGTGGDKPRAERGGDESGPEKGVGADEGSAVDTTGINPFSTGGKYKVYEMISNTGTHVAPFDMDLPGLSAVGPAAGGCVLAGGISFLIGFRRRLL
ncbi:MAG: Ig-like domain-containing protein [Clostridiales Family XIII bacterium]|jgi:hypothetical protein|nr:Ig-like domain-containing protein [Clostridiales Family XIII bacterium]